jgi:predicted outer membrane repeat protein
MTTRTPRRFRLAALPLLEDRTAPAMFTAVVNPAVDPTGAIAEVVGFVNAANTNADPDDTIQLFPGGTYPFLQANDKFDGGTALPVFTGSGPTDSLTLDGRGATFSRGTNAESMRFLRAAGATTPGSLLTLTLGNLTLTGGAATDKNLPSRSGSVFGPTVDGGAVLVEGTQLRTTGVRFLSNSTSEDGGAVGLGPVAGGAGATHVFTDTTFLTNAAGARGGAVAADQAGAVAFVRSAVSKNQAGTGAGGVFASTAGVSFEQSVLSDNLGAGGGADVSGAITFTDAWVDGNLSSSGRTAGAVSGTTITATRSTFSNNVNPSGLSGGTALQAPAITLVNTTVDKNSGPNAAVWGTGSLDVRFSTITRNTSSFGLSTGGGLRAGTLNLVASVVAKNDVADVTAATQDIFAGTITSGGFNFVGIGPTNFAPAAGDRVGTGLDPLNPSLGNLQFFGGAVPVRPPRAGSPLLDTGGPAAGVPTDARGFARPAGAAADTGAVEAQAGEVLPLPPIFTATINPQVNNAAAVAELVAFFGEVNANAEEDDVINLWPNGKYQFDQAFETADGGTALPVLDNIDNAILVNGNGATFYRPPGAPSFRFFRAVGQVDPDDVPAPALVPARGPSVTINTLTFQGGNTFSYVGANRVDPTQFVDLSGGAIRTDNARLRLADVQFVNNTTSDNGGAVAVRNSLYFSKVHTFDRAKFSGNFAGKGGGAVFSDQTSTGGLIASDLAFTDATFRGNASITGGGAIETQLVEVTVTTADFIGNRGNTGAAATALITATDTVFRQNVSTGDGPGAVLARNNMLTLIRSTVAENISSKAGAAVGQAVGQAVELVNTTVTNNTGADSAVRAPLGQVVLTYSAV